MRLDRLYAITLALSNGRQTTAEELARRFEVSVRTIYRDLEALDLAGVPILTTQGAGGGVSLMPGYCLDGGYFNRREMNDLAETLRGITPLLSGTPLSTIADKVTVLQTEEEAKDSPIRLDFAGWPDEGGLKSRISVLIGAIRNESAVEFSYTSLKPEASRRVVEPLTLVFRTGRWYLSAWCRLRRDYRWFTVMRIDDLHLMDTSFDRRSRLREMPRDSGFNEPMATIRLALTPAGAIKARPYIEEVPESGNSERRTVTLKWPVNEWLFTFILGLGPDAEILEPPELRQELILRLGETVNLYSERETISKSPSRTRTAASKSDSKTRR